MRPSQTSCTRRSRSPYSCHCRPRRVRCRVAPRSSYRYPQQHWERTRAGTGTPSYCRRDRGYGIRSWRKHSWSQSPSSSRSTHRESRHTLRRDNCWRGRSPSGNSRHRQYTMHCRPMHDPRGISRHSGRQQARRRDLSPTYRRLRPPPRKCRQLLSLRAHRSSAPRQRSSHRQCQVCSLEEGPRTPRAPQLRHSRPPRRAPAFASGRGPACCRHRLAFKPRRHDSTALGRQRVTTSRVRVPRPWH
jgi:hypothetical protein